MHADPFDSAAKLRGVIRALRAHVEDQESLRVLDVEKALHVLDGVTVVCVDARGRHRHGDALGRDVRQVQVEAVLAVPVLRGDVQVPQQTQHFNQPEKPHDARGECDVLDAQASFIDDHDDVYCDGSHNYADVQQVQHCADEGEAEAVSAHRQLEEAHYEHTARDDAEGIRKRDLRQL